MTDRAISGARKRTAGLGRVMTTIRLYRRFPVVHDDAAAALGLYRSAGAG